MIIVFSGTGNSLAVARGLRERLGGDVVVLDGELLLRPSSRVLEVPEGEDVVWVFPIYSWGVPPVVADFIRKSKIKGAHEARHFMVCTCGDDIGYADNQWRQLIGRRGWSPRGVFSVQMPNTYVLMKGFDVDSPEAATEKLAAMPARLDAVAASIRRGFSESDVIRGSSAWLKTAVVYPLFRRFCMSPRPFHAIDSCTSCGLCARSCPMQNISMAPVPDGSDGTSASSHPSWGNRCALCLRCYHICPSHAVAYGHETASKGQKQILK